MGAPKGGKGKTDSHSSKGTWRKAGYKAEEEEEPDWWEKQEVVWEEGSWEASTRRQKDQTWWDEGWVEEDAREEPLEVRTKGKGKGKKSRQQDGKGGQQWVLKDKDSSETEGASQPAAGSAGITRSQLNSSAPDFKPSGLGGAGFEVSGYWGWQPMQTMEPPAPAIPPPLAQAMLPQVWREYADTDGTPYYYNSKTGLTQWERPAELDGLLRPAAAALRAKSGLEDPDIGLPLPGPDRASASGSRRDPLIAGDEGFDLSSTRRGKGSDEGRGGKGDGKSKRRNADTAAQRKVKEETAFGPPGCNLFVFHLPDDWDDVDLQEFFSPHGLIASAKVMKEFGTGRSRGFGFVSYEERASASSAIKKMQGFKILGKRLKVEYKKGEAESGYSNYEDDEDLSKTVPDDERLIGYLRAISAKNVVQSLKEGNDRQSDQPAEDDVSEDDEN